MAFALSQPGLDTGGSDDIELFLKQYSGEVLLAYDEMVKIAPTVTRRKLRNQKSSVFPVIGKSTGKYHAAGEDILTDTALDHEAAATATVNYLDAMKHAEKEVFCDDLFISPLFISELDELRNFYDVRAPYARKQGMALARNTDINLMRVVITAANETNGILGSTGNTEHPGGTVITSANSGTDGGALLEAIKDVAIAFDDNDVPEDSRYCALAPTQYYLLVQNQDLLNRDFGGGENGIFSEGTVFKAWGMELIKTNLLPTDDSSGYQTAGQRGATYLVDASNTTACCWQKDAIGSVSLMDVQTEVEYIMERQGHLMLAKVAEGHDFLLPQACAQIQTA